MMRRRSALLFTWLVWTGCNDSVAIDDPDGAPDEQTCRVGRAKLETFLSAHRACERDDDCAIIGGCSNSIGFTAVQASAREEAMRMAEGICRSQDGPLYDATCEQNRCVARRTGAMCGGASGSGSCRDGQALYPLGCNGSTMEESCARHCDGPGDARCPAGFSCQQAPVFDQGCGAPPSSLFLCKATAACEVALSLDTDGGPYVARATKSSITATLASESIGIWAENLTGERKTLRYRPPCPAPARLTGLGTYDPFGTCLAGACPDLTVREVVLEPGARSSLGTAQVSADAGDCGPGLTRGVYEIGLVLPELSGAVTCGPEAFQLVVR